MNRKQRIIVSITGIVLVSLILIGLTYAYFLTQITGNTNTKSISVSTANLVLEYGENTNVVQGITNAEPGYSVEKIFTATNKGNSTVTYGAALESIVNELSRQEDLVYTLTCTSYLKEGFSLSNDGTITGTVDGTCNEVSAETKFPSASDLSIMVNNTIDTTHTQAYKLTITYKEMGVDQSVDMNKTFSAKVNIVDVNALTINNPYKNDAGTLKKAIIDNAMLSLNETEFLETPKTVPAKEPSGLKYHTDKVNEAKIERSMPINTIYQQYYWTYGTGYTIDENTGKFTLTGVSTCKYNDGTCNTALVEKYLVSSYQGDNSSNTNKQKKITDLYSIYKVTEAPLSSTSSIKMKVKEISSISYGINEKELSIASDDYGISYYYRGGVEDNYVNFTGMCWRIVRIEGDGSIKLILEDRSAECNSSSYTGNWSNEEVVFGQDENGKADFLNYAEGLADSLKSFQDELETRIEMNKINKTLKDFLKVDNWCYDDILADDSSDDFGEYYGAYKRIFLDKKPSFICSGTKINKYKDNMDMYVGTLTADEMSYAGATDLENYTHYLINSYVKKNGLNWWGISPSGVYYNDGIIMYTTAFILDSSGSLYNQTPTDEDTYYRPAVTFKSNIKISSGDGTKENPYEIAS